jgi:ubiquinone/menaquinone biosynthesis C-methylase UbiE
MTAASIKPYRGMGMEGRVAKWYATNTRKGIDDFRQLARKIAVQLPPAAKVLEVAPGPGYFAVELARLGSFRITGLDISETFVAIAKRNAEEAHVDVDFQHGNAANMPFENDTFDFLLCRAAFKNFTEPLRALEEMHRVLKPGGRGLIIDLRKDASQEAINQAVDGMGLNLFNRILTKFIFRFTLLKRAYTKSQFQEFFDRTKFQTVDIQESLMGLDIWIQK